MQHWGERGAEVIRKHSAGDWLAIIVTSVLLAAQLAGILAHLISAL